jgi:type II secretory pathway pseudopilin PulG
VLAVLWLLGAPAYGIGGLALAFLGRDAGLWAAIPAVIGLILALLCAVMGFGLWSRSPWARLLQIGLAVLGLCSPSILTCILILIYLTRPEARVQFSGRRDFSDLSPSEARIVRENSSDTVFALSILGSLLVAALLAGLLAFFANPWSRRPGTGPEARAIARLEAVAAAQEAFRAGTCDAYADLEGLIHPSSVIPNYPAGGPPFLDARYGQPEDAGYRFDLRVEDPVAPAAGCPARSYRQFAYAALPLSGTGPNYVVGPDRVVRTAEGRPAGPEDPATAVPQ